MKRKISNILDNSFLKNSSFLVSGTVVGQIITIVVSPLLTRLYTPSAFGELAIFMSTINIIVVIATLRFELAIPLPKSDKDSYSILLLAFGTLSVVTISQSILFSILNGNIFRIFGVSELFEVRYLIPLGIAAVGAYQILNYWATRNEEFKLLACIKTYQAMSMGVIQLGAGMLKLGSMGLMIGYIIGKATGLYSIFRSVKFPAFPKKIFRIKKNFNKYKNFPLYTTWATLVNVLGTQAPPIILNSLFTIVISGYFSLTVRILMLPIHFIGQAIGQVIYPKLAKIDDDIAFSQVVLKLAVILTVISLPIFLSLHVLGEKIFEIVFGEEWKTSGTYAKYISLWLLFSFISSPLSTLVFIKDRQRTALSLTVYETTLRIGSLYLGFYFGSAMLSVILYSLSGIIITSVYTIWIFKISGCSLIEYFKYIYISLLKYISLICIYYFFDIEEYIFIIVVVIIAVHEFYYFSKSKIII